MSRERQQRRAEREAEMARRAAEREAAAQQRARREARRRRVTAWVPRPHPVQAGSLAERKRRQVVSTALLLVVVNLVVYGLSRDPGLSALLLVASVLGAPIVHMMIFRRT